MSDRDRIPKRRTHKKCKGEETKKKRKKNYKDDAKTTYAGDKTPPLPTRKTSIEELISKREALKQELKKISKHSDNDLTNHHKSSLADKKHSQNSYTGSVQSRKRTSRDHEHTSPAKKKLFNREHSPIQTGDYAPLDSDDEEALIEKSRQRRRQFLETLNTFQVDKHMEENSHNHTNLKEMTDSYDIRSISPEINVIKRKTTDMFSETDEFFTKSGPENITQDNSENHNTQLTDNWDDSEGYYNVRLGDEINNKRYTIKSILGQGVFANVVRAQDNIHKTEVAIKIVRNNEVIYKTGLKEIEILKEIREADTENKYHCVKFLRYFMHKNHLCLVLESLYLDMRGIIKKYGKQHGINMKALTSYSRQLLIALRFLKKIGIIHADIKPDNILVNEKKNILKLCDFGSAFKVDSCEATPYLVSRFYRAPEIILGIPYKHSVDIWSAACTMYEMATGKIMFMGSCNNKMLKCFIDLKGKFPSKIIRKGKFKDQHFNYNNNFLLHKKDEITGRDKVVETCNTAPTRDLLKDLKKHCKNLSENEDKKLLQLKDILDKMFILDLNHRISVNDCLRHPFIQEELLK